MANLNAVGRLRVLFRMLHPDPIDDTATLAAAMFDPTKSLKYATPFYTVYHGPQLYEDPEADPLVPRDPTNAELAQFALTVYRRRTREIRQEFLAKPAGDAAEATEKENIATEFETDLGADS